MSRRLLIGLFTSAVLAGLGACGPDVLHIESISGGRQASTSTLKNGAESTTIYLASGYQRVLLSLSKPAGLVAAGADSRGVLPMGAVALADSRGSYIPVDENPDGTVAAELPAGQYWLTTTNQENLHLDIVAQGISGGSSYGSTQQGIGTYQQALRKPSWIKSAKKVLKVTAAVGVGIHVGCGIVVEYLKKQENVVCKEIPAWVPDVGPLENCAIALFGCPTLITASDCCEASHNAPGCFVCGY